MQPREMTEAEMREANLQEAKRTAYENVCPMMSRAERRTAKGRMLIAQAETASLKAEIEFMRQELALKS